MHLQFLTSSSALMQTVSPKRPRFNANLSDIHSDDFSIPLKTTPLRIFSQACCRSPKHNADGPWTSTFKDSAINRAAHHREKPTGFGFARQSQRLGCATMQQSGAPPFQRTLLRGRRSA